MKEEMLPEGVLIIRDELKHRTSLQESLTAYLTPTPRHWGNLRALTQ